MTQESEEGLPRFVAPQLATPVDEMPKGGDWIVETKLDGYRALAAVDGDRVRIHTRNGLDWTHRYPVIADALATMGLSGALLDGEIVAVDEQGRTDFAALQRSLSAGGGTLSYFVFDLLAEAGRSLRKEPLLARKRRLREVLGDAGRKGPVYFADHVRSRGALVLDELCDAGFEGVIAKRENSSYRSGRGRAWLKIKCSREQEFVIVGWSPSTRDRPFSSLLLGLHENGELRYAGRVGAGFSARQLDEVSRRMRPAAHAAVGGNVPATVARSARWVRPELVAQIEFSGFTSEGLVRQGRFVALREDKAAAEIVREIPQPAGGPLDGNLAGEESFAGVRLTRPDRVLYPDQGVSKRDLAQYYVAVAERMLPHVAHRLLSLVRCPRGRGESCFFQRHRGSGLPDRFNELTIEEQGEKSRRYVYIDGRDGLVAAVQAGVLELHVWGSRVDLPNSPDRLVFDLDPDPAVAFAAVRHAATDLRDVLDALGLASFALLTGGKGIHVVAPILRRHDWRQVKAFARAVAQRLEEAEPDRYVATMSKRKRKGRIFIDHFRNDRAATAIAPYSTRRSPGAPLAWPVAWSELDDFDAADDVKLEGAPARLRRADPWQDYGGIRQGLKARAFRALGL